MVLALPEGDNGLAAVRAMTQWVLDYPADCNASASKSV